MPTVGLSVDVLADRLAVNKAEIVKVLFTKGVMVQVNQQLDVDTVRLAAAALGAEAIVMDEEEVRPPPLYACWLRARLPALSAAGSFRTQVPAGLAPHAGLPHAESGGVGAGCGRIAAGGVCDGG